MYFNETTFDHQSFYVEAKDQDMVLVYAQTMLDPLKVGPALCEASFAIDPRYHTTMEMLSSVMLKI